MVRIAVCILVAVLTLSETTRYFTLPYAKRVYSVYDILAADPLQLRRGDDGCAEDLPAPVYGVTSAQTKLLRARRPHGIYHTR